MKNLILLTSILVIFCLVTANAQENNSLQEAIDKGKSDLLEILKQQTFDLNVDIEQLQSARGTNGIPFKQMDFQRLLNYEQEDIERLLLEQEKLIVPLSNNNNVITTISVAEKGNNFEVTDLINRQYATELEMLPEEAKRNNFGNVTIVKVQNLTATLYIANGKVYTSYENRELREAQNVQRLLTDLKNKAVIFQEKYGDILKRNKLVD